MPTTAQHTARKKEDDWWIEPEISAQTGKPKGEDGLQVRQRELQDGDQASRRGGEASRDLLHVRLEESERRR